MNSNLFDTYKLFEESCKSDAADVYYAWETLEKKIRALRYDTSKNKANKKSTSDNSNSLDEMNKYISTQKHISDMEVSENSLENILNKSYKKINEILNLVFNDDNEE